MEQISGQPREDDKTLPTAPTPGYKMGRGNQVQIYRLSGENNLDYQTRTQEPWPSLI